MRKPRLRANPWAKQFGEELEVSRTVGGMRETEIETGTEKQDLVET